MKLNLNTILIILGGLGVFAPDIASVAAWLASMNIAWLGTVIKGMGLLAAFCSAAPLVVPRLRAFLALLGLATPPGASAPWDPRRDAGPPAAAPCTLVGNPNPPLGSPGPSSAGPVVRRGTYGPDDHGIAHLACLAVLAFAAVLGILFATVRVCRADTPTSPQLGGCVANGAVCFGTAADVVLTKVGLSADNKGISGGFSTGVGYGATFAPARFYATGLDLFLNVNLSGAAGVASRVSPALMLHAMNYLFIGVAMDITAPTATTDSYGTGWSMLLGFGSTITSITPGYAKAEAARQLAAEKASAGGK
jgi:hypothetical protein